MSRKAVVNTIVWKEEKGVRATKIRGGSEGG
jgi:hypothetical protein